MTSYLSYPLKVFQLDPPACLCPSLNNYQCINQSDHLASEFPLNKNQSSYYGLQEPFLLHYFSSQVATFSFAKFLYTKWSPCYSLKTQDKLLLQNLCAGYFLCLEYRVHFLLHSSLQHDTTRGLYLITLLNNNCPAPQPTLHSPFIYAVLFFLHCNNHCLDST